MRFWRTAACLLTVLMLFSAGTGTWAAENEGPVGHKVKPFELRDYRGKAHRLSDFSDQRILVIAFLGTECPLAKLYGPRLEQLRQDYAERGVGFVALNANSQDSITEIASYARNHELQFPILKDLGNTVADQLGAVRTPEVFVLDQQRVVRYWGRIDDQYGVEYARNKPRKTFLQDAIDDLLADREVAVARVDSVGCHIGRIREPQPDADVTYSNQVSRILQKRCVECHRAGEIAPFALTEYAEVAGWAETIDEVVQEGRMPPWHANPKHGDFLNDRSLSQEERDLIHRWVRAGAPEGDPAQVPKPKTYTTGWQLPQKPDLVVAMRDRPFKVPATGAVRYQYFRVDPGFKEDVWFQAAQALPGNRAVVHHILVFSYSRGRGLSSSGGGLNGYLVAYVPGLRARSYPTGMAKKIPAGSQLIFQVHYTPIGTAQEDLSKVGFVFADRAALTHEVTTTSAVQRRLRIPANDPAYEVTALSRSTRQESLLLSFTPHMHLRGSAFRYELRLPDGKTETLLDVPDYDFNWQTSYRLQTPRELPAGARIRGIAQFDNSEDNLSNPDPNQVVRWGDQTWNEMMIGYFDVALPVEPDDGTGATKPAEDPRTRRARELMERLDKNSDGELELNEVSTRWRRLFGLLDRDKNNRVTLEELKRIAGR